MTVVSTIVKEGVFDADVRNQINSNFGAISPFGVGAPTPITANGAVDPTKSATYVFTKAGVAAMTLAAPVAGTGDGVVISFSGTTTDQNTVTATGLFQDGAVTTDKATWPAHAGGTLCIMSYNAKWILLFNNLVVMS